MNEAARKACLLFWRPRAKEEESVCVSEAFGSRRGLSKNLGEKEVQS